MDPVDPQRLVLGMQVEVRMRGVVTMSDPEPPWTAHLQMEDGSKWFILPASAKIYRVVD